MEAGADARSTLRVLALVTLFGLVIRFPMLETLPLLLTADSLWYPEGRGYLAWAQEILAAGELGGPAFRTPGYPLLLAGAFAIAGVRDHAVLGLHHLAGLATVALITWIAAKRAGPRVALVTGALAALDPWHLLFAHYALTESSMVFFAVASAAAVLLPSSRSLVQGVLVGLLAGATCLIRPSGQLLVPFLGVAYLVSGPLRSRQLVAASAALVLGLALSLGPWLVFNAARGIRGLAVSGDGVLFSGLLFHRLLDARDIPAEAPEGVRLAFGVSDEERADPDFVPRFPRQAEASGLTEDQRQAWVRASLARNLGRYPSAAWDTLRTLLDVGRPKHPPVADELLPFVLHLTTQPRVSALRSHALRGAERTPPPLIPAALAERVHAVLAHAFDQVTWMRGVPQLPLALLACVATPICLRRGRWADAIVLAGTLAFLVGHALILHPYQRYLLPAAMLWYLAIPHCIALVRPRSPAASFSDANPRARSSTPATPPARCGPGSA